jgi:exopolysaccharide biosynthesis polyprenyl glycosylphosphotransferase
MDPNNPHNVRLTPAPPAWYGEEVNPERASEVVTVRPLRRRVTAAARHTDMVQGLLMGADAAAGAFALGVGAQMVGGAVLTPVALVGPPLVVPLARMFGLYAKPGRGLGRSTLLEVPRLAQLATLVTLLVYLASNWLVAGSWHVAMTVSLWASLLVALPVGRAIARRLPAAVAPERCLVIGSLDRSARVRRTIHGLSGGRSLVVGWISPEHVEPAPDGTSALREAVEYHDAEHVVVAPAVADSDETLVLIHALEELEVRVTVLPRLLELASATLTSDVLGAAAALDVKRLGLSRADRALKRALDILGAAMLLLVTAPAAILIAIIVKTTSPGPALFRQQRIGRDGREFTMLKFRTMTRDAEGEKDRLRSRNEAQGLFKMTDDPRVTPVGRFLRRTSLDELPQLLNVLRGSMSLVGPRPLIPEEDGEIAGWHRRRLYMRPGMTGVWQVMGSARVPMHEMVELDNLYVVSWSPWLDLKILLRTLAFVLARRGL